MCSVLPFSTSLNQCTAAPHSFYKFHLIMLAGLLHLLGMFLPSRLLTLPKISEKIEISVNSPKTIKRESDVGTPSMATTLGQRAHQPATDEGMRSSTASSLSERLDTTEAETETLRSLTPGSSVESDDGHSRNILSLCSSWTEQSEKVSCQRYACPSSHTELRCRQLPDHLTTSCLCLARTFAHRSWTPSMCGYELMSDLSTSSIEWWECFITRLSCMSSN